MSLDSQTLRLAPDSTLLLYTDGVTEAFHPDHGAFGDTRLQEILTSWPYGSSQALCDRILETVVAYSGDAARLDDITVVAVRACREAPGNELP
jgi:sigma-B regulation protein RsbU (phosphoserine phosphatase)